MRCRYGGKTHSVIILSVHIESVYDMTFNFLNINLLSRLVHACPDLLQDSSVKVALLSNARPDSFKGSSVKVAVGIGDPFHILLKSLISHAEPSFRILKI